MLNQFSRHDLVWLEDGYLSDSPVYVVTHQNSAIPSGMLSIACCLSADKSALSRKCFVIPQNKIIRHEKPLLFDLIASEMFSPFPQPLFNKLKKLGITLRVYGSFAWQYLTGYKFTTPYSDIDLLFYLPDEGVDSKLLSALHELILLLEYVCPNRVDGELAFANGSFVAWREWFNTETKVLLKTTYAANLLDKSEIIL